MTTIARQSTALELAIGPVLDADGVAVTDCVVGDFKLKKTTGNFAALNASATLTHVSAGMYDLVLTTSDTDTVGLATIAIDDTVNACAPVRLQVIEEAVYDMLYASSATGYIANQPVDVNTIKTQTVTCAGGVTIPAATLASTTNITAGTITTVTNLTNLPTIPNNWLTAAGINADAFTAAKFADDCFVADNFGDDCFVAGNFADGFIVAASFAAGAVNAAALASDAVNEIADQVWEEALADHEGTVGSVAEALADAGGSGASAADIADAVWDEAASGHVTAGSFGKLAADILVDTAEIGAAGAGLTEAGGTGDHLTALPWNASWDAEVQSEVQDAIEANHLDHFIAVADPGGIVANSSFLAKLVSKSATPAFSSYDNTTDSLEANRDRGDAAWTTATGFSTHSAADVWSVATRVLTAGTNIQLPSNGLANVTAWTVAITGDITGNLSGSVGSVTTKTGYKLASDGLDLVVPSDPSAIPVLGTASIVSWIGFFGLWSVGEVNSDSDSVNLRNSADTADLATYPVSDSGTVFSSGEPT